MSGTPVRGVELVELSQVDPRFIIDPPYATEDNVFRQRFYPTKRLFLVKDTAKKLVAAQDRLERDHTGLLLKIWDAFRPRWVQRQMWKVIPNEEFVADPEKGSVHNRGCAVDVTLARAGGAEIPMPTRFDDFTQAAYPKKILQEDTPAARNFRVLLRSMEDAGFEVLPSEWWHFNDCDWRRYPVLDIESHEEMPGTSSNS